MDSRTYTARLTSLMDELHEMRDKVIIASRADDPTKEPIWEVLKETVIELAMHIGAEM